MPRFLVIRFSSIGDIVLTSPVVRCLKQQLPDAEVHFLTKKAFAPVVEHNPYIDNVWLLEEQANLVHQLKATRFDAIIDLHHNLRSQKFTAALGVPAYRFHKLNFSKWLLVNFKINQLPDVHIVDRYLDTVAPWGVHNDGLGLDYFTGASPETLAMLPPEYAQGYIALVIGAAHVTKIIPADKAAAIIREINRPVILLGGKDDRARGEAIRALCPGCTVWNAAGEFSLHASASLVQRADLVITGDTGLMHIAAAFKKKIISIWGNTVPALGMTPYLPEALQHYSVLVENTTLRCRPCSKLGFDQCPKQHFRCMTELDTALVAEQAQRLLSNA